MKVDVQSALSGRTYERHGADWREVEPRPKTRTGSLLRGLGAIAATACAVAAIAVIGIVVTVVALVLWPVARLAARSLEALPVQGMERNEAAPKKP
jgi:hypothetical protein